MRASVQAQHLSHGYLFLSFVIALDEVVVVHLTYPYDRMQSYAHSLTHFPEMDAEHY